MVVDFMAGARGSQEGYFPRLDGLRCLAVMGVLPVHFVKGWMTHWYADTGDLGVKLFFVLSGYLIISVLLGYRDRIDRKTATRSRAIYVFYARRLLRLSPVYYAYLILASFLVIPIRPYLGFYFFYMQNLLFAARPALSQYLTHFWTLAIEEQFYLVAPVLVLSVPRTRIRTLTLAFVATGVLFRVGGVALGFSRYALNMMMPSQMDALGMGALLAVLRWEEGSAEHARRLERVGIIIGLPLALACRAASAAGVYQVAVFIFDNIALGLLFVAVVGGASRPSTAWGWRLLELAPLVFIGRISYGVYVYHFNVPGLVRDIIFRHMHLSLPDSEWLRFLLFTIVSIVIATASFYLYERRFNRLKAYVNLGRAGSDRALA